MRVILVRLDRAWRTWLSWTIWAAMLLLIGLAKALHRPALETGAYILLAVLCVGLSLYAVRVVRLLLRQRKGI